MRGITLSITLLMLSVLQVQLPLAHRQDIAPVFNFTENLEHAYHLAKTDSKTIFLIVHDTRCRACRSLRPSLIESREMRELSKDIIMVQSLDSRDQLANALNPDDNSYVPRIIFIGCDGKLFDSIYNTNQPNYKSYYTNAEDVVAGMKKAIEANKRLVC